MARQSDNPEIAVLQDWRDRVDETLERIEKKIDHQVDGFVTKETFALKIAEIEVAIKKLENRKTLIGWVTPTLSAALGSVFTFLIIEKLNQ